MPTPWPTDLSERTLDRRTVARAAAWTAPVVLAGAAAPAATASAGTRLNLQIHGDCEDGTAQGTAVHRATFSLTSVAPGPAVPAGAKFSFTAVRGGAAVTPNVSVSPAGFGNFDDAGAFTLSAPLPAGTVLSFRCANVHNLNQSYVVRCSYAAGIVLSDLDPRSNIRAAVNGTNTSGARRCAAD